MDEHEAFLLALPNPGQLLKSFGVIKKLLTLSKIWAS
jgi:hypothetical protein